MDSTFSATPALVNAIAPLSARPMMGDTAPFIALRDAAKEAAAHLVDARNVALPIADRHYLAVRAVLGAERVVGAIDAGNVKHAFRGRTAKLRTTAAGTRADSMDLFRLLDRQLTNVREIRRGVTRQAGDRTDPRAARMHSLAADAAKGDVCAALIARNIADAITVDERPACRALPANVYTDAFNDACPVFYAVSPLHAAW